MIRDLKQHVKRANHYTMRLQVLQAIWLEEGDLPKDKFDRVRPGGELVASHLSAGQRPGQRVEQGRKGESGAKKETTMTGRRQRNHKQLNTKFNAKNGHTNKQIALTKREN